jgi:hypothetical protein
MLNSGHTLLPFSKLSVEDLLKEGWPGDFDYLLFTGFISRPGWLIQFSENEFFYFIISLFSKNQVSGIDFISNLLTNQPPRPGKKHSPGDFTYLLPGHPSFKKEGKVNRNSCIIFIFMGIIFHLYSGP